MKEALWVPKVEETHALLVWGGDVLYLCHWMRESGLAELLPSLPTEMVYVGVFPHVDHPRSPPNSMANAERWAAGRSVPTYAIDDDTAIKVVDGAVEVVSEGHWQLFTPR